MLHIDLVTVGRIKERFLQDGIAEYMKRLRPYARVEIIEVDDEPCDGDEQNAKAKEGDRILKRIAAGDWVIALDRQGEMLTSLEMATAVKEWEMSGRKVVFVIGGSAGLSEEVLRRADRKVSFSKLTFPHQLFRLMLVEQIYRAFKIARGEKYHK
jgi:23S rRNA (pseudouridine1915-N3)-methyltransferase